MLQTLNHLKSGIPAAHTEAGETLLAARFHDLNPPLNQRQAAIESARCLYCYDAPCTRVCPTGIDVPQFIRQIAEQNINGAAQTILDSNILGASCARVCPTEILCEQSCVRNHCEEAEPVRIGLLQRYATDHMAFETHPFQRAAASGRRVAIVGAGPAGLSCAHQLARRGHEVVIYEARPKAGGLNEYGIARYKMTHNIAQREIDFLLQIGGIRIEYDCALGQQISLSELQQTFDAVFLAFGLAAGKRLALANEDAAGMLAAIDYIAELRQTSELQALPVPQRCIVIGAGNTAIDMAVQIARLGASEVSLVYRRGAEQMSATEHEQSIARQNGVRIVTWAAPQQVLLNQHGQVSGMRFAKTRIEAGRLVTGEDTFEIAADAVFKAIGQQLEDDLHDPLLNQLQREAGKIQIDSGYHTSIDKVYAGGDCIADGLDLTVQAVQHGKLAALAIDQDLMKRG